MLKGKYIEVNILNSDNIADCNASLNDGKFKV